MDKPIRDHFDKISIRCRRTRHPRSTTRRFSAPARLGNHTDIISFIRHGKRRAARFKKPDPAPSRRRSIPTIATASAENGELRIQLRSFGPDTRISLVGKRYDSSPWNTGMGHLCRFTPPVPGSLIPGFTGCGYLTDRRLSDEMRYILDRRGGEDLSRFTASASRPVAEPLDRGGSRTDAQIDGTQGKSRKRPKRSRFVTAAKEASSRVVKPPAKWRNIQPVCRFPAVSRRCPLRSEARGRWLTQAAARGLRRQPVHRDHRHGCLCERHVGPAASRQRHSAPRPADRPTAGSAGAFPRHPQRRRVAEGCGGID